MASPILDTPDWEGTVQYKYQLVTYVFTGNIYFGTGTTIIHGVSGKSVYLFDWSFTWAETASVLSSLKLQGTDATPYHATQISGSGQDSANLAGLFTAPGVGIELVGGDSGLHIQGAISLRYYQV